MTEAFFRDQHYVFMLSGATGDIFPPPLLSIFESTITALKPWLLRVLKYNIFVHHPSIATDTSLRSASTWEFNGANFRLSSAAMSKVVNANWFGVQTYAPGACADLLVDTGLVRSGDFSGAQLDPSLSGFWLAGEQAVLIGGTCQWQTRAVRLIP
jgi:hypothetical protein